MEISASRREGYTHDVVIGDHSLVADEPEDKGGTDLGASPTGLLAGALAACAAITVEMYADRKGWELPDLKVSVEVEGNPIKGDASYEVILHLPGGLTEEQTQRITTIAGKCPVHKALAGEVPIEISNLVGER
ncbi:MAG: OsmC family protein [Thermoleophilia bacterium]|jgi:putative redox protein|nr:OsmC family protein [Thermoleophilia bacterium]